MYIHVHVSIHTQKHIHIFRNVLHRNVQPIHIESLKQVIAGQCVGSVGKDTSHHADDLNLILGIHTVRGKKINSC